MARRVTTDVSQLRVLSQDLASAPRRAAPKVAAVVFRGALQIKAAMVADAQASRHFKGIARSIDFDTISARDAFAAEIGPRSEPGEAGNLANIAYFGGSRGGGTVRDPQEALDDELPKFTSALEAVLGDAL